MRRWLAILALLPACDDPPPPSDDPDAARPEVDAAADGPGAVRAVHLATTDRPDTGGAEAALAELTEAIAARWAEESGLELRAGAPLVHVGTRSCGELGATLGAVLVAVGEELAPVTRAVDKHLIVLPCSDPEGGAAGVAWLGGNVAIVFAGSGDPGLLYLSTVGTHELGHSFGLVHNSVGTNCLGAWETLEIAGSLLDSDQPTRCVLLPHQTDRMAADASAWMVPLPGDPLPEPGPSALAQAARGPDGAWRVTVTFATTGAGPRATGVHVERDGVRIGQVPLGEAPTFLDEDRAADYHDDPEMDDPGLETLGHYCYALRYHDADGHAGPPGPEACVDLIPLP